MGYIRKLLAIIVICCAAVPVLAQDSLDSRVSRLEYRVIELDRQVQDAAGAGIVLVLFGAFCALWAQNTKRNAWLWFFVGLLFNVIAVFVVLFKNAYDRDLP
jgi:hypothetical protein